MLKHIFRLCEGQFLLQRTLSFFPPGQKFPDLFRSFLFHRVCHHKSFFIGSAFQYSLNSIYNLPKKFFSLTKQKTSPRSNGLVCIFWKALRLLNVKETDGLIRYGFLYRVRRSFKVFSWDRDMAFGWIGLIFFGLSDSNVVCF